MNPIFNHNPELPLGLGMALAHNQNALVQFAKLNTEQKQQVILKTHEVRSKKEMAELAQNIADGTLI